MIPLLAPHITIVDVDSGVALAEIQKVAAALQRQLREHVAPIWGDGAQATVTAATAASPGDWEMPLIKAPDVAGALGYHTVTAEGLPRLPIFPLLDQTDGVAWSTTASHEAIETVVDWLVRWLAQMGDGRITALEACDAVEAQSYLIDGVAVSNFVTPEFFAPPSNWPSAKPKFDFLGQLTAPGQIAPGGYLSILDGNQWTQVGTMRPGRAELARLGLSRSARRRAQMGTTA